MASDDRCMICGHGGGLSKLGAKGLATIVDKSVQKGDDIYARVHEGMTYFIHSHCRTAYCRLVAIKTEVVTGSTAKSSDVCNDVSCDSLPISCSAKC